VNLIALALTALCCFFGSVVVVLAVVLLIRHSQARDEGASVSDDTPPASQAFPPALDPPAGHGAPFPVSESAHLGGSMPGSAPVLHGGTIGDEVEDFDEDEPTTLVNISTQQPQSSRTPNLRSAFEQSQAPTDRSSVPRLPQAGADGPSRIDHVPAPDEPPPLPASHAPAPSPPSTRRLDLDPAGIPGPSALQPGATIIPPDDWIDDHIDDDDVDETMLMARPPLPPKK
jgi:hypothetical protein